MTRAHKPTSALNLIIWSMLIALCVTGAFWIAG